MQSEAAAGSGPRTRAPKRKAGDGADEIMLYMKADKRNGLTQAPDADGKRRNAASSSCTASRSAARTLG